MGTYERTIEQVATAHKDAASAPARSAIALAPELVALALYGAMLIVMVPRHEPWADEAQAWQLARTLPYFKMLFGYLGYEGSPGLWHTLLWFASRAGVGYAGMHWLSAAIAFGGVAVFLLVAPFPRYVKLAFPFTYYIAYQYAIIARSYVLFPLILFLTLYLWRRKTERPVLFALLLGLMANISLHTAMVSGGLALICMYECRRDGKRLADLRQLRFALALGLLIALYALAIVVAKPPADNASLAANPVWTGTSAIAPLARVLAIASGPSLSSVALLNLFFWAIFFLTFIGFENPVYLAPIVLLFAFSCVVFAALWHYGILYLAVVAIFWITWDRPLSPARITLYALLAVASCQQIAWTISADIYDYGNAYSADRATADFLKPYVKSEAKIAAVGALPSYSVGLQPYFDRNIYFDQKFAFWWWSTRNHSAIDVRAVIDEHPDVVIDIGDSCAGGGGSTSKCISPYTEALTAAGYTNLATFCGAKAEGFRVGAPMCHVVFGHSTAGR